LIKTDLQHFDSWETFDLIVLHFVLEHDVKDSLNLIKEALSKLSKTGTLSIVVPNFNAFHREFETSIGTNKRNEQTRLSEHDTIAWHQIIYDHTGLEDLIVQAMQETWLSLDYEMSTNLPRPLSFKDMQNTQTQELAYMMNCLGHIPEMEHKWSVLCMTVWTKAKQLHHPLATDTSWKTAELFKQIIDQYIAKNSHNPEKLKSIQDFLQQYHFQEIVEKKLWEISPVQKNHFLVKLSVAASLLYCFSTGYLSMNEKKIQTAKNDILLLDQHYLQWKLEKQKYIKTRKTISELFFYAEWF
jgi:hypothetical protein